MQNNPPPPSYCLRVKTLSTAKTEQNSWSWWDLKCQLALWKSRARSINVIAPSPSALRGLRIGVYEGSTILHKAKTPSPSGRSPGSVQQKQQIFVHRGNKEYDTRNITSVTRKPLIYSLRYFRICPYPLPLVSTLLPVYSVINIILSS